MYHVQSSELFLLLCVLNEKGICYNIQSLFVMYKQHYSMVRENRLCNLAFRLIRSIPLKSNDPYQLYCICV